TWPQKIHLSAGAAAALKLDSGIRLSGRGMGSDYYFQVIDGSGRAIDAWQSTSQQLLPPGRYTVQARPDSASEWKRVADNVEVRPGSFTDVNVPSLAKSGDQGNSGFHH